MIRVFVVAESALARAGIEALLRSSGEFEIAGSAPDSDGSPAADVVVYDWTREDEGLPEAAIPTVLLTAEHEAEWTRSVLRLGARAVLRRDATAEEIAAAVRAAAAGLVTLEAGSVESLVGPAISATPADAEPLTARETEVLRMLAEGEGNKTIAWKLGISEHTVKFHVASILAKLRATSRTEAVTIGIRRGWILL